MAKAGANKDYKLLISDHNRRSTVQGILISLLKDTKKKWFLDFPATFKAFEQAVFIDDDLKKINRQARPVEEFWKGDIRNAGKDMGIPDALTAGQLLALRGGGFAIPESGIDRDEVRSVVPRVGLLDKPEAPIDKPKVAKVKVPKKGEGRILAAVGNMLMALEPYTPTEAQRIISMVAERHSMLVDE